MNKLKFRGKRKDNGKLIFGNLIQDTTFVETRMYILPTTAVMVIIPEYEVFPETVGQFTGLLDKNGVEIYEGDTVLHFGSIEHQVIFQNGTFGYFVRKGTFVSYFNNFFHLCFKNNKLYEVEVIKKKHLTCLSNQNGLR